MQIREASEEDVIGIIYVQATTWIEHYPQHVAGITEEDIRQIDWQGKLPEWRHMIKSSDYSVLVAAKDEEIHGFVAVAEAAEQQRRYILHLYVLPQKQHSGIGAYLLDACLQADEQDIWLDVAYHNYGAIRFYERYGFIKTGAEGVYRLPSSKTIPTITMLLSRQPSARRTHAQSNSARRLNRTQLARQLGLRESTVKWYTELGLLPYQQADTKRRRYYDPEEVSARLQNIHNLRAEGLSLEQIRQRLP